MSTPLHPRLHAHPHPSLEGPPPMAAAANQLPSQARPSIDDVYQFQASVGLGTNLEQHLPCLLRGWKRSMSIEAQRSIAESGGSPPSPLSQHGATRLHYVCLASSSARPVMGWLGTAKVFTTAGLIESNNDAWTMRSVSRLGVSRTGSERNARMQQIQQQHVSSRTALSDASRSNSLCVEVGAFTRLSRMSETA
jgi:hypothetical protein